MSNGHGEDAIAVRILQELRHCSEGIEFAALPLVGIGQAYRDCRVPIVGPVKPMPSGGFIYMDWQQLWQDLRGGLWGLFRAQLNIVRQWAESGGIILAVGDIVPLGLAWWSGAAYGFVGTAKSEYYLRNNTGWYSHRPMARLWDGWSGSVYLPWERWLMSRSRCQAVFPRDSFTARTLERWPIPVYDLGNPMMDQLQPQENIITDRQPAGTSLTLALLPGSRPPEAYENWQLILQAVQALAEFFLKPTFPVPSFSEQAELPKSLMFLAAISSGLNPDPFSQMLVEQGWWAIQPQPASWNSPEDRYFEWNGAQLILTQHRFNDCLHRADLAIALAGTATEQFVGLGKPAIVFPGRGPQCTYRFVEAQSRMLGESLILLENPGQVPKAVGDLLSNPDRLHQIAKNGQQRMGQPGAAARIARCWWEQFGSKSMDSTHCGVL
ncbi:MAG: hypothetical protein HC835_03450 [Oscillatoriales cyanobacterium RM2_1_1]|nr:hypothetical protein [Oscillatoriales cyanobacterium SM2_3_0]NJO44748.1 hypothetical protein [Oscillatoriales cyanobacterium RM2_1_1]